MPRSLSRRRILPGALAALVLTAVVLAGHPTAARAAVPAGYAVASNWTVTGTVGSGTLPGNAATLGPVTVSSANQVTTLVPTGWNVDGVTVPRVTLQAASVTQAATNCLNGAPVDTVRTCNGATAKNTTITFPEPVVDPVLSIVSRAAVFSSGTGGARYCSTAWMNHAFVAVNGAFPATGQVTAVSTSAAQRLVANTLTYDPTIMQQTANECADPTRGDAVSYIKVTGVISSIVVRNDYTAMVTRNARGTSPRPAAVPPGWQFQTSVPQADLALVKTAPDRVTATGEIEWALTVFNNGSGPSHGYEVTDVLPPGLTDVTVVSGAEDCTINEGVLRCSVVPPGCIPITQDPGDTWASLLCEDEAIAVPPVLAAGAAAPPIIVRATTTTATPSPVANTATVSAVDVDIDTANNTARSTTLIDPAAPAVGVAATVDPAGPVVLDAGAVITYAVTVSNTGNLPVADAAVAVSAFDGAPAPAISCPPGSVAVAASVDCTGTYAVTQADVDRGSVTAAVAATASSAAGTASSPTPASATVTITRAAGLAMVKTASVTEVTSVGQPVEYSFTITNTGNVTVRDPQITETDFSGGGDRPVATCPAGPMLPGASIICTAGYTVVAADAASAVLSNTATATAAAPDGVAAPTSAPSTQTVAVAIPVDPGPPPGPEPTPTPTPSGGGTPGGGAPGGGAPGGGAAGPSSNLPRTGLDGEALGLPAALAIAAIASGAVLSFTSRRRRLATGAESAGSGGR